MQRNAASRQHAKRWQAGALAEMSSARQLSSAASAQQQLAAQRKLAISLWLSAIHLALA